MPRVSHFARNGAGLLPSPMAWPYFVFDLRFSIRVGWSPWEVLFLDSPGGRLNELHKMFNLSSLGESVLQLIQCLGSVEL